MQCFKPSFAKFLTLFAAVVLLGCMSAEAQVDTLASIKQKGKIVVGVKTDAQPFGYVDSSLEIVGFEIDLAKEIAKKLGVKIELIPVLAANRMEIVRQGRVDLVIATMSYKPERAEVIAIPEPFYYASAAAVFAKKNSGLKEWTDLKGKTVCGVQGAYYNRRTGDEFGAKLLAFKSSAEALAALEAGNCVGVVFDSTFFIGVTSESKWADYAIMLPLIDPEPWGVGLRKEDTKFAAFIRDIFKEWHKTGYLIALEQKWGIEPSPYLIEQKAKFK